VLDTACARLALGQNAIPAAIEDLKRQLDDLTVQERVLRPRSRNWDRPQRTPRNSGCHAQKAAATTSLDELNASKWDKTKGLVEKIRDLRTNSKRLPTSDPSKLEAFRAQTTAAVELGR
jgi:type VI secretion system protein VasG